MEADHTCRFRVSRNLSARKQCFDLGSKAECPAVVRGVERLNAVGIARQEEATLHLVPDSKSEHATQPVNHPCAVTRVEMQECLRVGGCAEVGAFRLEFSAELRIVVNLAVEHDDKPTVLT